MNWFELQLTVTQLLAQAPYLQLTWTHTYPVLPDEQLCLDTSNTNILLGKQISLLLWQNILPMLYRWSQTANEIMRNKHHLCSLIIFLLHYRLNTWLMFWRFCFAFYFYYMAFICDVIRMILLPRCTPEREAADTRSPLWRPQLPNYHLNWGTWVQLQHHGSSTVITNILIALPYALNIQSRAYSECEL